MHDAVVLQIGARLQNDAAEVAAKRCAGPHIAARADDHVADEHGSWMDKSGGVDDGNEAVDFIEGHLSVLDECLSPLLV